MSNPMDILQKKLKFTKIIKNDAYGNLTPAISIASRPGFFCYLNAALSRYLMNKDIDTVSILVDAENECIGLEPTDDKKNGYRLTRTGGIGFKLNARLGTALPAGRYVLVEERSTEKLIVFSKAYTTHTLMKGAKKHGKN